jgi:CheY-like chemotaxis protein
MLQKKPSTRPAPIGGEELTAPQPQRGALIMVAEDDDDNRLMMKTLLEMKGYRVAEAKDGQEAVAVAKGVRPDLILVDLQLPLLNGFAVTRFVRLEESLRDVPIVVVSGHDPAKHRKLAIAAGCNEYLHKPIDFVRLEEVLTDLVTV